jgi:hypothetical protein
MTLEVHACIEAYAVTQLDELDGSQASLPLQLEVRLFCLQCNNACKDCRVALEVHACIEAYALAQLDELDGSQVSLLLQLEAGVQLR